MMQRTFSYFTISTSSLAESRQKIYVLPWKEGDFLFYAAIVSARDTEGLDGIVNVEFIIHAQGSSHESSLLAIQDMHANLQIAMSKIMPKIIKQCGEVKKLEVICEASDDPVCYHLLLIMNEAERKTGCHVYNAQSTRLERPVCCVRKAVFKELRKRLGGRTTSEYRNSEDSL